MGILFCLGVRWSCLLKCAEHLSLAQMPCLSMVAWAWVQGLQFEEHLVESGYVTDKWAIPQFASLDQFFQPGRDALKAMWCFATSTGLMARPEMAVPKQDFVCFACMLWQPLLAIFAGLPILTMATCAFGTPRSMVATLCSHEAM